MLPHSVPLEQVARDLDPKKVFSASEGAGNYGHAFRLYALHGALHRGSVGVVGLALHGRAVDIRHGAEARE